MLKSALGLLIQIHVKKKKLFFFFFFFAASGLFCSMRASLVAADRLRCAMACGILVPQLGVKPVSPALEGELSTTAPTEKSLSSHKFEQE